ncbi:MAG: Nif3-like dinuclear metal center hexameric protein [Culicoidibacterales bacterium]
MAKTTLVGQELIRYLETYFPQTYAMENDPVGLQIGTLNKKIKTILVALDVDQRVCDEAIAKGVDLIIAHHPFLYRPLTKIATDTPKGKIVMQLIKNDIAVYAAHTNLDIAPGGLNDWLAQKLGLTGTRVLSPTGATQLQKFIGYVPETHLEHVREAVMAVNHREVHGYRHCAFMSPGTGSFESLETASPFIGEKQQLNFVEEIRLEFLAQASDMEAIISRYCDAHPYEVPAYETVTVEQTGSSYGLGRIGELPQAVSFNKFISTLKKAYRLDGVRVVGAKPDQQIRHVAILGGSGSGYWRDAKRQKADVYLTGDIGYHDAQEAVEAKMMLVDIGHYAEHVCKENLHKMITHFLEEQHYDAQVLTTTSEVDPFEMW